MKGSDTMKLNELTPALAADRLELFIGEQRLVQGVWHRRGDDGRELACALGAFHSDIDRTGKCPASVMPQWCAELIVTLFDCLPSDEIYGVTKDFATALRRTEGFSHEQWETVRRKFLHACISQALESARSAGDDLDERGKYAWGDVQIACGDILDTLAKNQDPTAKQCKEAAAAAAKAAKAEAWVAARTAWVAAKAEAAAAAVVAAVVAEVAVGLRAAAAAKAAAVTCKVLFIAHSKSINEVADDAG